MLLRRFDKEVSCATFLEVHEFGFICGAFLLCIGAFPLCVCASLS